MEIFENVAPGISPQLTLFAADSLASLLVLPGSKEARMMTASSGRKCSGLSRNSGPLGCLERMLAESSAWRSTVCLLTWRERATPAGRLLFRLAPSMPRTGEIGSGLWPTPKATIDGTSPNTLEMAENGECQRSLDRVVLIPSLWPTPRAGNPGSRKPGTGGRVLAEEVKRLWPTPKSQNARGPGEHGNGGMDLQTAVARMPFAALWLTPDAQMAKHGEPTEWEIENRGPDYKLHCQVGGALNPMWVEWLMGFPEGWTDLKR